MKNNIYRNQPNDINNYYNHSDNLFYLNKGKNVMNKAKESIKSFRSQFLINNENNNNNKGIAASEENLINPNIQFPPYYPLSEMNKAREELNDYDLYFGSTANINKNNEYDNINQENNELRKKIMDLVSENKNLQNKINGNNNNNNDNFIDYLNNLNTIENKPERDNITNNENNNNFMQN